MCYDSHEYRFFNHQHQSIMFPPFWGEIGIDLHLLEVSQRDRVDQERRQVCRPEVLGGYGVLLNFKNDGFIFRMKGCLLRTCVTKKI